MRDVVTKKHFPRYWPFVQGIHWSPVNSPHKGRWRGALMFSLICAWIYGLVNNGEAGDLRRHRAHSDVTVMWSLALALNSKLVSLISVNKIYPWITGWEPVLFEMGTCPTRVPLNSVYRQPDKYYCKKCFHHIAKLVSVGVLRGRSLGFRQLHIEHRNCELISIFASNILF